MSPRKHDDWKEQLPAYLLGALNPGEKIDMDHHLGGCAECQSELRWLEPARQRLATEVRQVEPSPGLKTSLMAAVVADLAENPVAETDQARAFKPEPESVMADSRSSRPRKERRSWFDFSSLLRPVALGAVAAVLFAGVVAGYVVRGGAESGGDPVVATTQTLPGKTNVGNSNATMVTSGDSGTLKISDLPKLEEGEVYQAWIQKGQSVYPTDSLFTPRKDGTATTSIPDLNGVNIVMVSAEPAGGSDQPTTAPILTIEIPS